MKIGFMAIKTFIYLFLSYHSIFRRILTIKANQNYYLYYKASPMEQFARIFRQKLSHNPSEAKTPVVCAIADIYQTHQQLLASAQSRRQTIEQKNARIAAQNLKYRQQLDEKIHLLQSKAAKNRKDALNKVVKTQEHKRNYRKDIFGKHNESEKNHFKERAKSFKETHEHMRQFWIEKKSETERMFERQVSAKPLYNDAVSRKKSKERQSDQLGLRVKSTLLKRHEGRQNLVYDIVQKKKEQIHEIHKEIIQKNLQKHEEIVAKRIDKYINDIGSHFQASSEVLDKNFKTLAKRIKDRAIDDNDKRTTIRSNFLDRFRNKSASLSNCQCKRINNVEQGLTKSLFLKEQTRNSLLSDTLKKHIKDSTQVENKRNQFINRSQSLLSTVLYNKDTLRSRELMTNTERLTREKSITDAINLKKQLEKEANCLIRRTSVK